MKKYAVLIEYDGAGYNGWQLQKGLPTVQGALEEALERILKCPTRVYGAGRTDAGVHAAGQTAHFSADWKHRAIDLRNALNAVLPRDTAIHDAVEVPDTFHARHSALWKTYAYRIDTYPVRSPLTHRYAWHAPETLDTAAMAEAATTLVGVHDFAAFGAPTDGTPSTVREISAADWIYQPQACILVFRVRGTGFLRYMVRCLVGTLALVGRGRIDPKEFSLIRASCDRSRAGPSAPPHGLFLESVEYADVALRSRWTQDIAMDYAAFPRAWSEEPIDIVPRSGRRPPH